MKNIIIYEMKIADYEEVYHLWSNSHGIGLSTADSQESIANFLKLNPGLCFIAREGEKLAGAVLCGCDGRRGYLYHLAVKPIYRKVGIGRSLTQRVLEALKTHEIQRCHIFVMVDNSEGKKFWDKIGWKRRDDLYIMSHDI
jgi:ribosomal protein S18 acetylase RimI-like enzyme